MALCLIFEWLGILKFGGCKQNVLSALALSQKIFGNLKIQERLPNKEKVTIKSEQLLSSSFFAKSLFKISRGTTLQNVKVTGKVCKCDKLKIHFISF